MKRRTVAAVISLILLMGMMTACRKEENEVRPPRLLEPVGVTYDTEKVIRGDMKNYDYYPGIMTPETKELEFGVNGTVKHVNVHPGDWVEEGTVLIELDQESIQKQIDELTASIEDIQKNAGWSDQKAQLNIAYLQVELEEIAATMGADSQPYRIKALAIEEAAVKQQQAVETRNRKLSDLQTTVKELKEKMQEQVLTAPIAGTVYYPESVAPGANVIAGRAVCYIIDPSVLTFAITSVTIEPKILEKGTAVIEINGSSYDYEQIRLSEDVENSYRKSGRRVPQYFRLKGDVSDLTVGMTGMMIGEKYCHENALLIPVDAVLHDSTSLYVYVANGENREKRFITTGISNGIYTEVLTGLNEGEVVYVQE